MGYELEHSGLGVQIGDIKIPGVFFADDICITVPVNQMRRMMDIISTYALQDKIEFSPEKSGILAIGYKTPTEPYHMMSIPDGDKWDEIDLKFINTAKYLGVMFSSKYGMYTEHWNNCLSRIQASRALLGCMAKEVVNPLAIGDMLWNTYGLPSFAYAWEIIGLTKTQQEKITKEHRNYKHLVLNLPHYTKNCVLDDISIGIDPLEYKDKLKIGYWWYIQRLPETSWVYKTVFYQAKLWERGALHNGFWLHSLIETLDRHGIPHIALWSKSENKLYWNSRKL